MPASSVSSRFDIGSISSPWHAEWRKTVLTQCCPVSPSVCNSAKIFCPVSMPSLVPCPLFMLLGDYFRTLYQCTALPSKEEKVILCSKLHKSKKKSYMQLHFSTLVKENSLVKKKKHLANICQKYVNGGGIFSKRMEVPYF